MSNWRTWSLRQWNERLLDHFFRRRDDQLPAVIILLVTADELARATGDTSAPPGDVRDAFVEAVRTTIAHTGSLLEDASNYQGWPGAPRLDCYPRFAGHLFFTCIAASESSDDLGDEGSFVSRLRDLSGDRLPEHSLQMLPRLWEHLASWLAANEDQYRRLSLPAPGGLTRIGYTVKLAFPDRRDQRQLSDLLDRAGLSGHEPPVGRVVSLVASERSRFRSRFLAAFDEFRRIFESHAHPVTRLANHRFWAAVRDAALRGRGQSTTMDLPTRLSLLGHDQDDRVALFGVAEDAIESDRLSFVELPVVYGNWRYAAVPQGANAIRGDLLDEVVGATLSGALRLPRISSFVEQGVLPFVAGTHGLLELFAHEQLSEVTVVLVRDALLDDFLRHFGRRSTSRPSSYQNWTEVHDPALRPLPHERIDNTTLSRAWILHETLAPTAVRLVGGVRADDGWLGAREVLPRVVLPGASSVVLEGPECREELTKLDNGEWPLPSRDFAGAFNLLTSFGETLEHRQAIRFHSAPASESFKTLPDLDTWIVEGLGGTVTLSDSTPFSGSPCAYDYQHCANRLAYLGAEVGQFVTNPNDAAWAVTQFGGRLFGARGPRCEDSALPTGQIADAHARRRWRKMLLQSSSSWIDPGFDQARAQVKSSVTLQAKLPLLGAKQVVPDLAPLVLPLPDDASDRLVRVLAGRASTRAGLPWRDWAELVRRILKVDDKFLEMVTRAWMESGLIDSASYARWCHRSVIARKPCLVAFRVGDHVGATLMGLALRTTRDELKRTALKMSAIVEERLSVSSLVPSSLAFRMPSARHVDELGRACSLHIRWLDIDSMMHGPIARHDGTSPPPTNYEWVHGWPQWSLTPGEYAEVRVEHCMRRDRPDYWVASHGDVHIWSYDLNVVRAWAAALLRAPILTPLGEAIIEAKHAYVPLALARALAVVGAGLPGPNAGGGYRYPVGSPRLRELVLDIVTRTFDPLRLARSAAHQATG